MRKLCLRISGGVSLLICLILFLAARAMGNAEESQKMAERWSEKGDVAQISCFFSVSAKVTPDSLEEFRHSIDGGLREASVTLETQSGGEPVSGSARLWADAYSAAGKITLKSSRTSLEADAIGIGGDFFLFHPLKLVKGSYFSGNDLMQDYCVIDEDAAWQLFGSSDVAGQLVEIGGIPHMIVGVVERPEGRLQKAAGLESTVVYVSYQTLSELGTCFGINHYEVVMPNPVSNFALNFVKERIGVQEKELEALENTSRYSLAANLQNILAFGTRSMNGKAIIYPYWENVARGYEDILAILTVFLSLFLLYPLILALVWFVKWWRHKGWTIKDLFLRGRDKWELFLEKRRADRASGKRGNALGEKKPRRRRKHPDDLDFED